MVTPERAAAEAEYSPPKAHNTGARHTSNKLRQYGFMLSTLNKHLFQPGNKEQYEGKAIP